MLPELPELLRVRPELAEPPGACTVEAAVLQPLPERAQVLAPEEPQGPGEQQVLPALGPVEQRVLQGPVVLPGLGERRRWHRNGPALDVVLPGHQFPDPFCDPVGYSATVRSSDEFGRLGVDP